MTYHNDSMDNLRFLRYLCHCGLFNPIVTTATLLHCQIQFNHLHYLVKTYELQF